MSNHRPAADPGPSLISIWILAAACLVTIALSLWLIWDEVITDRHIIGMAMGMLLAVQLGAQAVVRAMDRDTARRRIRAYRARRVAETTDEAVERRWPTPERDTFSTVVQEPDPVATQPWPQPIDQPGPWQDREPTQRLTPPPSPAALRSLNVPVFRDEADRQAFLARQDTEIFSRPPDWQS